MILPESLAQMLENICTLSQENHYFEDIVRFVLGSFIMNTQDHTVLHGITNDAVVCVHALYLTLPDLSCTIGTI